MSDASVAGEGDAGSFVASDDASRWTFEGALTFDNAARAVEAAAGFPLPTSGSVDLAGLRAVDSAALAVVFALKRRARAEGRELKFEQIPADLVSLARVYGVVELI